MIVGVAFVSLAGGILMTVCVIGEAFLLSPPRNILCLIRM
jgi:hypothetical protein